VKPLRILLAEDHRLVRAGLRALLESGPGFEVVGEAASGHEALPLIAQLHPDVVLMDISMPGLNGLEATRRVVHAHPRTRVVMLSMHADEEYVRQALLAGAAGYLLKDAETGELEVALRAVVRGDLWLSPAISRTLLPELLTERAARTPAHRSLDRLTSRQREILQLIAEGTTTKQIAQRLRVSVKTVETHRANLMERLEIHDVPGLVRFAIRVGIVALES
jgi:DNA-binding NarL/FixJ family response regulator